MIDHLVAASTALDIVDVGGIHFGIVQDFLEQLDLLHVGGMCDSFQPESFLVRARAHRGGVRSLGVFGALQVQDDHGITADTPLAWNRRRHV